MDRLGDEFPNEKKLENEGERPTCVEYFAQARGIFAHMKNIFAPVLKEGRKTRKFCNLINTIKEELKVETYQPLLQILTRGNFTHMHNIFAPMQKEGRKTNKVLQPSEHYKGGTEGCNLSTTPKNHGG
ncbi:hypothetical protein ACS0TY_034007 [Phlomoides rotata]